MLKGYTITGCCLGIFTVVLFGSACPAQDNGAETRPAAIGDHPDSLLNRITFPDVRDEVVNKKIRCTAILMKGGRFTATTCYYDQEADLKFVAPITKAAMGAKAVPAKFGGRNVMVWFQFTVHYIKLQSLKDIRIYPNYEEYPAFRSRDYSTPQQIYEVNRYTDRQAHLCSNKAFYVAGLGINKEGKLESFDILDSNRYGEESCANALEKIAGNSEFIPGFVLGKPITMKHVHYYSGITASYYIRNTSDTKELIIEEKKHMRSMGNLLIFD